MRKLLVMCLGLAFVGAHAAPTASCEGRFMNPITDICWSCMFPMFIGPLPFVINIGDQKGGTIIDDDKDIPKGVPLIGSGEMPLGTCTCQSRSPILPIGLMMSWHEPTRLVDVTRSPFCMVGLGGVDLSAGLGGILPAPGYGDSKLDGETSSSFYQTHWFMNPIMAILGIMDVACTLGLSKSLDLLFMTEVDPAWNDDSLSVIFAPEVILFTSLPAQLACGVDCVSSSLPNSTDELTMVDFSEIPYYSFNQSASNPASSANPSRYLFWCGGCQGSLYPLNGNNTDSAYAVQSSILTTEKLTGLVHRMGLENITTGVLGMCSSIIPELFFNKSEWKYSMGYPVPQTTRSPSCCNAIGETDTTWNSNASFPYTGEDFTYIMYHERDCCFL